MLIRGASAGHMGVHMFEVYSRPENLFPRKLIGYFNTPLPAMQAAGMNLDEFCRAIRGEIIREREVELMPAFLRQRVIEDEMQDLSDKEQREFASQILDDVIKSIRRYAICEMIKKNNGDGFDDEEIEEILGINNRNLRNIKMMIRKKVNENRFSDLYLALKHSKRSVVSVTINVN
jgi:hypothetical protein